MCKTAIFFGDDLSRYTFGRHHPFNSNRLYAFWSKFRTENLHESNQFTIETPVMAEEQTILLFHDRDYVDLVKRSSKDGKGFLDRGDTPAFKGIRHCYEQHRRNRSRL